MNLGYNFASSRPETSGLREKNRKQLAFSHECTDFFRLQTKRGEMRDERLC